MLGRRVLPPNVDSGKPMPVTMPGQPGLPRLDAWMQPFRDGFTTPTWQHVLVLIIGTILAPGRRTVAAALQVVGRGVEPRFTSYHRVRNRNRWSSRRMARGLLHLLVNAFVPTGPIIIGLDDTLERRWGAKIKALPRSCAVLTWSLRRKRDFRCTVR